MILSLTLRKRHSLGRYEDIKWFSLLITEKDNLYVDKKTLNDSVSDSLKKISFRSIRRLEMSQSLTHRKRYSLVRLEDFKRIILLLIEKDILLVDKKTWNESVSYSLKNTFLMSIRRLKIIL